MLYLILSSQSARGKLVTNIKVCRFLYNTFFLRMTSSKLSYENAVQKLNSLQSNKSTIEQIRRDIRTGQKCTNLEDMKNYLLRTGVTLSKLDELSVIHVAGTKGKGSTSAMCESILRHYGFKTGFYSSPHLVAVRERIRLDGRIISKEKFAKYFHDIYDMLDRSKAFEGDMPKYFAFLTVMAYNVFLKEKIDVAIVEVGIGGLVDYTNILRKVPVIGITSLGLDHTSILGNTLTQIAEAKAGIMKPGCEAYTVTQPPEAMIVLEKVAAKVKCPLRVVPDFESYTFPKSCKTNLQLDLEAYRMNASLSIQLAHAWMRISKLKSVKHQTTQTIVSLKRRVISGKIRQNGFTDICSSLITDDIGCNGIQLDEEIVTVLPSQTVIGVSECKWPGRYHVIEAEYARCYLDGAHTKESMEICAQWFKDHNRNNDKVLIFSATGDRDAEVLLKPLKYIGFQRIFFVIPISCKEINKNNDNYSVMEREELLSRCYKHAEIWKEMQADSNAVKITVLDCVSDALNDIKTSYNTIERKSVLITGSLHLVGAALSILDSSISRD